MSSVFIEENERPAVMEQKHKANWVLDFGNPMADCKILSNQPYKIVFVLPDGQEQNENICCPLPSYLDTYGLICSKLDKSEPEHLCMMA